MKTEADRPAGNRILGDVIERREKAWRFTYYGKAIWIPKKAVTKVMNGPYTAPAWAIDSGLAHPSREDL